MPELVKDEFGNLRVAEEGALGGATTLKAPTAYEREKQGQVERDLAKPKTLTDYANAGLGKVESFSQGFASGVTFGGSDALMSLDEASRLRARNLREENPYSTAAGEIASVFVPFGAAGKAAAAGDAIRAGIIRGGESGILRNMVGRGAGAAFESGAMAGQSYISESVLGDTELNGEKFLQHVALGAVLGGVMGTGEGFIVGSARKAIGGGKYLADRAGELKLFTPADAEKLAGDVVHSDLGTFGKAYLAMNPAARTEDVLSMEASLLRKGTKAQREQGERIFKYMDEGQRHAAMDARAYEMANPINEMVRADAEFSGALKYAERRDLQGGLIERELFQSPKVASEFERGALGILEEADSGLMNVPGFRKAMKRANDIGDAAFGPMEDIVDEAGNVIGRARNAEKIRLRSPEDVHAGLGQLRRELDDMADKAAMDPKAAYEKPLRDAVDQLDLLLENGEHWGQKAASAQRELNAAQSEVLGLQKMIKDGYLNKLDEADLSKLSSLVRSADKPGTAQKIGYMERYLDALENRAELVKKHLKPNATTAEKLERLQVAQKEMRNAVDLAKRDLEEFSIAKVSKAGGGQYGMNLAWFGAAQLIGLPGLAGAFAADVAGRYPMYLRRAYNIREILEKTDNRIAKGVANLFKRSKPGADSLAGLSTPWAARAKSAAKTIDRGWGRTRIVAGVTLVEQYQAAVDALSQSDQAILANAKESLGELEDVAPQITGTAMGRTMANVAYLRSQIPGTSQQLLPMNPAWDNKPTVSYTKMEEFMDKVRAVSDPVGILEEAKKGTLTRAMVRAVEETNPKLIEDIRQKILIASAESPTPPSYSSLVGISIVFGMAATPEMQPEYITYHQQLYATQAQAAPPPAKSNMAKTGVSEYAPEVASTSDSLMGPMDDRK